MAESKTVFEQLEEVRRELDELKGKHRTFDDQLNENDPKVIEFVKKANRVWRYCGEKSDLSRENVKNKKQSIIAYVLLAIYAIVPFLFIDRPYAWCFAVFSSIICIGQGILQSFKMKQRKYEMNYEEILPFWKCADLDDNGIVCATKYKWWGKLLKIGLFVIPILLGIEMLVFLEPGWNFLGFLPIGFCSLLILPFRDNTIYGYRLHFVDDKNDIEYIYLKEFMTRNNLK